jgi:ankyrin repeat protein
MFAARFSANPEVIKILLEKGADAKAKDKNGKKAIDYARENPAILNSEVLSQLEEMGKD